jgi:peptidoglycan LD-endopeptidase LytH
MEPMPSFVVLLLLIAGTLMSGQAPTPPPADPTGFIMPIAGGCLPRSDKLMPNAPRTYRKGSHEGIDFYHSDNCTRITRGTPVVAAKAGRVVRVDLKYVDVTKKQVDAYLADPNTEASLDQFRGRQVWIDHGDGIITRYCHLSGIAPGLAVGAMVTPGQLLGFVGESGTPSSVSNPGHEFHLHFELRVGGSFLGKDLPAARVRALYRAAFGLSAAKRPLSPS